MKFEKWKKLKKKKKITMLIFWNILFIGFTLINAYLLSEIIYKIIK